MLFDHFSLDNTLKSAKIIVVDDNPVNLMLLERILATLGFENVQCLNHGRLLFQAIDSDEIDLIILDLFMPGMDGFYVLGELAKRHSSIPVIVLSALEKDMAESRALELGAVAYLEKPIQTEAVIQTIIKILNVHSHDKNSTER